MFNITRRKTIYLSIFIIIAILLFNFGCAKKTPSENIAIKINDYTLTADEFNELFTELKIQDTPEARKNFLNNLIIQKLILQEAQKEGLDKKKDFLKAIENFWQQSLLKIAIDEKVKEASGSMQITEQEIENNYKRWKKANPDNPKTLAELHDFIKWQLLRSKQNTVLNTWVEELRRESDINIDRNAIGVE